MIKILRGGGGEQGWWHLQTSSSLRTIFAFTHPLSVKMFHWYPPPHPPLLPPPPPSLKILIIHLGRGFRVRSVMSKLKKAFTIVRPYYQFLGYVHPYKIYKKHNLEQTWRHLQQKINTRLQIVSSERELSYCYLGTYFGTKPFAGCSTRKRYILTWRHLWRVSSFVSLFISRFLTCCSLKFNHLYDKLETPTSDWTSEM